MSKFAVTLNYHGNYGYVEYDSENKKAEIVLGVAEAKAKVEKFLKKSSIPKILGDRKSVV